MEEPSVRHGHRDSLHEARHGPLAGPQLQVQHCVQLPRQLLLRANSTAKETLPKQTACAMMHVRAVHGEGRQHEQPDKHACLQLALLLPLRRTFNLGGPARLSRADMARLAARAGGWSEAAIQPVPSASVPRPCPSPPDIAMDSSLVHRKLGVTATPFEEVLQLVLGRGPSAASASIGRAGQ